MDLTRSDGLCYHTSAMKVAGSLSAWMRWLKPVVGTGLVLLLLVMAPFAVALEIHHALAAADHDGHQHSDADLCQWVQAHTANSLQQDDSPFQFWLTLVEYTYTSSVAPRSVRLLAAGSPRAPPVS
jgi:hypothetical protein